MKQTMPNKDKARSTNQNSSLNNSTGYCKINKTNNRNKNFSQNNFRVGRGRQKQNFTDG